MTLVNPAEDTPLSPASNREVNTNLPTHVQLVPPQQGTSYSCPECKEISPSMDSLKKHMETAHSKSQNTACKLCDKVYKTVKSLRRHEKTHAEKVDVNQLKTCSHCPRKFSTQTALLWHEVRNHIDTLKTSTCYVCGKEFSDHANLKRHLEMVHSLESASCSICKKTFKSFTNLQRHMNVTHAPDEATQICNICNKPFKCSMHLRIHIRTVHAAETVFSCDICGKEFPSKKYMVKHKKIHIDTREFPCSICSKLFKSTDDVRKHTKRVHMKTEAPVKRTPKSLICDICDKVFNHRKYMLLHKRTHTDVKPFACEHCDKLFKCASHVRKHIKGVHLKALEETGSMDPKFTCDICQKQFTIKQNMAKHIKIHYGIKDTPCSICDKLFKSNSDVNKHLKRVHMKGLVKRDNKETTNTVNTAITSTEYAVDDLQNIQYTENVLSSTKYTIKALEITEYTDEVPRSEDYRLETLGSAQYTLEDVQKTEYTLKVLGTSHTEALGSTDFIEEQFISARNTKDAAGGTELTEIALADIGLTKDMTKNKDFTDILDVKKDGIKKSEITMDELRIADEAVDTTKSKEKTPASIEFTEMDHRSTVVMRKAIRSTDIIKDALEISEFTMEDLGITEEAVNSIKAEGENSESAQLAVKALGCMVVAGETPRNNNIIQDAIKFAAFTMEDLGITGERVQSTKSTKEASRSTLVSLKSIDCGKEASRDKGLEFIKKPIRNTDIIREAIEISDFTMEDLGITEYTVNAPKCTDSTEQDLENTGIIGETIQCTGLGKPFGSTEGGNLITENTEFTDKALSNTGIIKEALNISDFTIDDLDITEKAVSVENAKENLKYIITDGALVSSDCMEALDSPASGKKADTENLSILKDTECRQNTLDTDIIKDTIENSDFTMEDLGFPEYPEDALESTGYNMDDLGIAECPDEVLGNTDFIDGNLVNNDFVDKTTKDIEFTEALRNTELTDTIGSKYFIEDALGNKDSATELTEKLSTDFLDEALKRADFTIRNTDYIEEELGTAAFTEEVPESTDFIENLKNTECSKALNATELIDKALGNTDNIKESIDDSEFTMEDLGIPEYTEGVLSTEYGIDDLEITECTDPLRNMELLNCLKCGVDFKNDVDLHTHLCGGEMTLFLDFQDM